MSCVLLRKKKKAQREQGGDISILILALVPRVEHVKCDLLCLSLVWSEFEGIAKPFSFTTDDFYRKILFRLKFCHCWLAYCECIISQNYYDHLHYLTIFWGRLLVLLKINQKHARQIFLYQHILEIHNSEIRVNSQNSSLFKCTFPAYDSWETWEWDHIIDTVFEFLKIFCVYIFFVIRHGCI